MGAFAHWQGKVKLGAPRCDGPFIDPYPQQTGHFVATNSLIINETRSLRSLYVSIRSRAGSTQTPNTLKAGYRFCSTAILQQFEFIYLGLLQIRSNPHLSEDERMLVWGGHP